MNLSAELIIIFGTIIIFFTSITPIINIVLLLKKRKRHKKMATSSRIFLLMQLHEAVKKLSRTKTGALITIEIKQNLIDLRTDGLNLDANLSSFLLIALFQKQSPLHDGAVIISGSRIKFAGTFYNITERSVSNKYGSRHRAALGISEQSDSVSIVVSEETGNISIVKHGKMVVVTQESDFHEIMTKFLR